MSTDMGPQYTGQPLPPPPAGPSTPPMSGEPHPHHLRRAVVASAATAVILAAAGVGYALSSNGKTDTGTTSSSTLSVAQLEAKVNPAVADIAVTVDYGTAEQFGTGIVLSSNGEVLTNNHVVEGATSIKVTDVGNGKTYTANVLGYALTYDVAVLQLKGASGLATATIGNSSTLAVGQGVLALGNAGGRGGTPSSATGTITALGQSITAYDEGAGTSEQLTGLIETDANIQSGDSGGPLVNMSGQVIGMDTAASSSFQFQGQGSYGNTGSARGYAIPINRAVSIAKQIVAGRASPTVHIGDSAFLGVQIASASSFFSPGYGFGASTQGVAIAGVVPGSPAEGAGLSTGDTITSVGGHAVSSSSDLRSLMTRFYPGQEVKVTWVDEFGSAHTATLKLASGPVG